MRAQSKLGLKIDLLNRTSEVGNLARLCSAAGFEVQLEPPSPGDMGYTAYLRRQGDIFLNQEITWLVLLEAFTSGRTPQQVLDRVQKELDGHGIDRTESFKGIEDDDTGR